MTSPLVLNIKQKSIIIPVYTISCIIFGEYGKENNSDFLCYLLYLHMIVISYLLTIMTF